MKAFVSYNEEGREVNGTFELVEQTANYIKIKSDKNTIIIPYHRINKIKFQEFVKGGNKK
jgi:sporulation protein YlmC with PRC-barrel domain